MIYDGSLFSLLILNSISTYAKDLSSFYTSASTKYLHYSGINEKIGSVSLLDVNSVKPFKIKGFKTVEEWHYIYKPKYSAVSYYKTTLIVDCNNKQLGSKGFITFYSVHDKFHRTLILSGFCLLKIAKISLNSSFFFFFIKR